MSDENAFAVLREARRVWAIGSIHGEADRLRLMHQKLGGRLQAGDRLVYLGNYLGYGPEIVETIDELLGFRREFLARPPFVGSGDLVFLRGSQEEMWHRVLQLQFAVDPVEVMSWMGERGLATTLAAYADDTSTDILGQRAGPLTIAQWTGSVRATMQEHPGHVAFMSALKRAAYNVEGSLLFVNAGIDTNKPVEEQSDVLWWTGHSFAKIDASYGQFVKVIRGYDPDHGGFDETEHTLTIDGGCGFGGGLIAVCLTVKGQIIERLET
jgi:serine/threonine protein phosphatase 1